MKKYFLNIGYLVVIFVVAIWIIGILAEVVSTGGTFYALGAILLILATLYYGTKLAIRVINNLFN